MEASDELFVKFHLDHEDQFVRFIKYTILLPSFEEEEKYNVTGYFYDNNGTVDYGSVDLSIFKRYYTKPSNWNLFLGVFDVDIVEDFEGIGCGILSFSRSIKSDLSEEEVKGEVYFSFDMKLSNFEQFVEVYFHQSLLNFIAQLFSLIGLSISLVGILFSGTENLCENLKKSVFRFCCFCCSNNYSKKDEEHEEEEDVVVDSENSIFEEKDLKKIVRELMISKERMTEWIKNAEMTFEQNGISLEKLNVDEEDCEEQRKSSDDKEYICETEKIEENIGDEKLETEEEIGSSSSGSSESTDSELDEEMKYEEKEVDEREVRVSSNNSAEEN